MEHAIGVHQCGEAEHVQIHFLPRDGEHADQRAVPSSSGSRRRMASQWSRAEDSVPIAFWLIVIFTLAVRATDDHPLSEPEHLADEEGPLHLRENALARSATLGSSGPEKATTLRPRPR